MFPPFVGNNVLIVAHASSLEACTRQLQGRGPLSPRDFVQVVRKVPSIRISMFVAARGSGQTADVTFIFFGFRFHTWVSVAVRSSGTRGCGSWWTRPSSPSRTDQTTASPGGRRSCRTDEPEGRRRKGVRCSTTLDQGCRNIWGSAGVPAPTCSTSCPAVGSSPWKQATTETGASGFGCNILSFVE